MSNEQAREVFNQAAEQAAKEGNADRAAKIELCREYFTNPQFKAALEEIVFAQNSR